MSRGVTGVGMPVPLLELKLTNPGFAFAPIPNEYSAAVSLVADATPHTAGAWTELIAATTADSSWMMVSFSGMSGAAQDTRGLVDIAYGAAASEVAKITSIPVGFSGANPSTGFTAPIWCPRGTRVSGRLRAFVTVDTVTVRLAPMRETRSGSKAATFIDTIGADTAASRGTNLLTSDTYVQLTAATTAPYRGLLMAPCGGLGTSYTGESSLYTLGVGASGAEVVVGTMMVSTTSAEAVYVEGPWTLCAGHFPKGSRIAAKQATGRNYRDIIVFGIPYA